MKLKVLGSAAAEGIPAIFCSCDLCRRARANGGKDVRRRTTYLLGDRIMVDWGPDAYGTMLAMALDFSTLRHLFVTHSHTDHFVAVDLEYRNRNFSKLSPDNLLTIHGNEAVQAVLTSNLEHADAGLGDYLLSFDLFAPGEVRGLEDGIVVEALAASHAYAEQALNFVFTIGGRRLVIGNDTGWWPQATWDRLAQMAAAGPKLNLVVLDATSGLCPATGHHHNAQSAADAKAELQQLGCLAEGAAFVVNHFSHNGGLLHADLEAFFGPHGIQVAYDGLEIEI